MQPAARVDGGRRLLGHVVVAQHHHVPAGTQLALLVIAQCVARLGIDQLDFDIGNWSADSLHAQFERVVGAGLRDDRRGFG